MVRRRSIFLQRLKGNRVRIPNSPAAVSFIRAARQPSHCLLEKSEWEGVVQRNKSEDLPGAILILTLEERVKKMKRQTVYFLGLILLCFETAFGQDSIKSVMLERVDVIATSLEEKQTQQSGDAIESEQIDKSGFRSVGEVVRFLSGVTVKDYGGVGGLKTVSVRGLGAMHTNVSYDGISISNAQNGQIDLSKFGTENIESLSLSNGNPILRLQTAKSLASANTLNIETTKPFFADSTRTNGVANIAAGSFGMFNPTLNLNHRFNEKLSASLFADILSSKGDYPYLLRYGSSSTDSSSNERRENNDFFSARLEANIFYNINKKSNIKAKAYFYHSNRGLPGPTTLYYLTSKQRLWNKDAFIQSVYHLIINENFDYKSHLKLSNSHTRYFDPLYNNAQGFQDDRYTQNEAYWNNILSWHSAEKLSLTLTNDIVLASLDAENNYRFDPVRFSSLSALIAAYRTGIFIFDFNILHTATKDFATLHKAFAPQNHFSPYASMGINTPCFDVAVFFKDIFRLPTFNDLYYNATGEVDLRPEKAKQYNLHLLFKYDTEQMNFHRINLAIDIYHNDVTDKIVSVPRNNYFIWSMVNYGKVRIDGLEVKLDWRHERIIRQKNLALWANLVYNYTYAIDNDKESKYYKQQIQYTARNSANAMLGADYGNFSLSYALTAVGKRYWGKQNDDRQALAPYSEHSLSLSYSFGRFGIKLSCNNLTNEQYEVIRSYPMQGRQWIVNLKYKFN